MILLDFSQKRTLMVFLFSLLLKSVDTSWRLFGPALRRRATHEGGRVHTRGVGKSEGQTGTIARALSLDTSCTNRTANTSSFVAIDYSPVIIVVTVPTSPALSATPASNTTILDSANRLRMSCHGLTSSAVTHFIAALNPPANSMSTVRLRDVGLAHSSRRYIIVRQNAVQFY
jgi:hypothetical protein